LRLAFSADALACINMLYQLFFVLAGPEGLGRKNFKIWTQLIPRIETHAIVECLHIIAFDEYDERYKKRND
jgi:hypothetical protein